MPRSASTPGKPGEGVKPKPEPAAPPTAPQGAPGEVKRPRAAAPRSAPRSLPRDGVKPPPSPAPAPAPPPDNKSFFAPDVPLVPEATPEAKPAPDEPGNHTVVTVFYGTDRGLEQPARPASPGWARWLTWTLACGGTTMILFGLGYRYPVARRARGVAKVAAAATVLLALGTTLVAWKGLIGEPEKHLVTRYGGGRGELVMGTCEVSVPKDHQVGKVESPSILRFEVRENPDRHVVLLETTPQSLDEFHAGLRKCVGGSPDQEALVFVHGYNVTFEDAARRTAQIAYDLKFEGAPIFFSWPSQGGLLGYSVDETNCEWAVPHLKEFLLHIAEQSGAKQIYLIAHSMGNRALTSALRQLSYRTSATGPLFREVVLTAPDIDADIFRRDIAPAIVKTSRRVTLYASSNDEALVLSKKYHGSPRAGESGAKLIVLPGVDTIDVSAVDTSLLGHSYYGSNHTVLADLFDLLHEAKSPDQRKWLQPRSSGKLKYWVFSGT